MLFSFELVKTKMKSKVIRVSSGKVKKKVKNCWTEEDLSENIHELQSTPGASIRESAKKYGVSESTIDGA